MEPLCISAQIFCKPKTILKNKPINFLKIIWKAIYEKSISIIILNGERVNAFPWGSGARQGRMAIITTSIQHCTGNSSQGNQAGKKK